MSTATNAVGGMVWRTDSGLPGIRLAPDAPNGGAGGGGAGGNGGDSDGGAGGAGAEGAGAGGAGGTINYEAMAKDAAKQRDAAKAAAKAMEAELAKLQAQMEGLRAAEAKRKADEEKAAQEAEQKRLQEAGEFKKALELKENEWKAKTQEAEMKGRRLAERTARSEIRAAVSRVPGVLPEAIDSIAELIYGNIGLDEHWNPFVKGDDGKPRKQIADPTKLLTIDEFAAEYVQSKPYFLKDRTPPGSGANAGSGTGSVHAPWDIERAVKTSELEYMESWKKADPEGFRKAFEAYKEKLLKGQVGRK